MKKIETQKVSDMTTQPEALRLAEILEGDYCPDWFYEQGVDEVSAELRRQHARITELESQLAQRFDAADMATAAAQGFRDGAASVVNHRPSLSAIFQGLSDRAYCNYIEQMRRDVCLGWEHKAAHGKFGEAELKGHTVAGEMLGRHKAFAEAANALRGSDAPLTYPSPPAGMVGGWMPIETAPKNGTEILGYTEEGGALVLYWDSMTGEMDHWSDGMSVRFWKPTHWMHLPAAPGPADGESNG
jgi:hypothetical protein